MGLAVEEQAARLREWQERDWELLGSWWEARGVRDAALRRRDLLVIYRGREVSRILGGMTARQRTWAEQHRHRGRLVVDAAARQRARLVLTRRQKVEKCEAAWAGRIASAAGKADAAAAELASVTAKMIDLWPAAKAEELTRLTRRNLAALSRRTRA